MTKAPPVLDAITDVVLAYRPKEKGQQAKKIERRVKQPFLCASAPLRETMNGGGA